MSGFNKQMILDLKNKLLSMEMRPTNEEATKQWLILPFIVSLGYDPYSSDVIPEYTSDVGIKNGEKVDYALQVNNQIMCLIECKQLDVQLSDKHVSQLYRYFTTSEVHIAILTNGNDYWFFTDSHKENIMDTEPYYKIRISSASDDELNKLGQYSKELIQCVDFNHIVQYERFKQECKNLMHGLKTNNIPNWLLETLASRSNLFEIDKNILTEYICNAVKDEFNPAGIVTNPNITSVTPRIAPNITPSVLNATPSVLNTTPNVLNATPNVMSTTPNVGVSTIHSKAFYERSFCSDIKLHHEYVFNDKSDGEWTHHTLEYAVVLGHRYNVSFRKVIVCLIRELVAQNKVTVDQIIESGQFEGRFKITRHCDFNLPYYIKELDVYTLLNLNLDSIVKFIEKLLIFANLPMNSVLVSFKD